MKPLLEAMASRRLSLLIAVISALVAFGLAQTTPIRAVDNRLADFRRSMHDTHAPYSDEVVIIAIDDQTLSGLPYASPIDRTLLAAVLAGLDKRKPSAIGLDVLLDRPSDPAADQALIDALAAAKAPIVSVIDPGASRDAACGRGKATHGPGAGRIAVLEQVRIHVRLGHGVQCIDGVDDVMRLGIAREAGGVSAFATALAEAARPDNPAAFDQPGDFALPVAMSAEGGWPFRTFSAARLQHVPDAWIAGKSVLIGKITPYSGDWRMTPMRFAALRSPVEPADEMPRGRMPGVVMHAFALDALLTGKRGPETGPLAEALAAALGALLGALLGMVRMPWWSKLAGVAALLAAAGMGVFAAYSWSGLLFPFAPMGLGLVLASGSGLALQERDERMRRQSIHHAFQHFLAPQVVDQLVRTPALLTQKADTREVSALFTDLAGFTRLIDELAPDVAADVLNGYLDVIVQAVMDHGGAVDKIVGDAVHALFSAPIEDPDHRASAVCCALAIEMATEAYRASLTQRDILLGETRIGLNAGLAAVGNFGARRRLDYTAHGSTINLAARLESANKVFGTRICLHETSCVAVDGAMFRPIGEALIRGLAAPVRLFELASSARIPPDRAEAYCAAMALADPAAAARQLAALVSADPDDGLAAFQLARAERGEWGTVITV